MPGGELLDTVRSKRALVALGASMVAVTALVIGIWPNFPLVFTALVLHGTTGAFLGPAIAAISLGVVGHFALAEQLGRNQRFASAGSLIATGLMGLIGYLLSYQAMFLIAAALVLPLLVALAAIRPADIDFARSCGAARPDAAARTTHRSLWKSPGMLTFAASLFLFQLANAAMLPIVGAALVYDGESRSSLIVAALIILRRSSLPSWLLGLDGRREAGVAGRFSSSVSGLCRSVRSCLPFSQIHCFLSAFNCLMASAERSSACSQHWSLPTLRTAAVGSIWLKASLELRPESVLHSALQSLA